MRATEQASIGSLPTSAIVAGSLGHSRRILKYMRAFASA